MPNIAMLGAVYDTFDYITRLSFVQTIKISKRRKSVYFCGQTLYNRFMEIKPIAKIVSPLKEKFGVPRQSGRVDIISKIVFEPYCRDKNALKGIEDFSHLWLIFEFDKIEYDKFTPTVRPPRLGGNAKKGVFATRSPFRPNRLGLSVVKLIGVEDGALLISGAVLVDGTPIYDIKPDIPFADCIENAKGGFSDEFKNYKIDVQSASEDFDRLPSDVRRDVISLIAEDPRPAYHDDERIYKMTYGEYNVSFAVYGKTAKIIAVEKI